MLAPSVIGIQLTPMIIGGHDMQEFHPAKKRVEVSADESVRILRALRELSQSRLFELTGIHQATTSAIENNRVNLGGWRTIWRAKVFARALKCHTAVLVFSGWKVPLKAAA